MVCPLALHVCSQRIIERQLSDEEIDQLALVAVAGMAAEGRKYEEVRWVMRCGVGCIESLTSRHTRKGGAQIQRGACMGVWAGGVGVSDLTGAYRTSGSCMRRCGMGLV